MRQALAIVLGLISSIPFIYHFIFNTNYYGEIPNHIILYIVGFVIGSPIVVLGIMSLFSDGVHVSTSARTFTDENISRIRNIADWNFFFNKEKR